MASGEWRWVIIAYKEENTNSRRPRTDPFTDQEGYHPNQPGSKSAHLCTIRFQFLGVFPFGIGLLEIARHMSHGIFHLVHH